MSGTSLRSWNSRSSGISSPQREIAALVNGFPSFTGANIFASSVLLPNTATTSAFLMMAKLSTLNANPSSRLSGTVVKLPYMGIRERLIEIRDSVGTNAEFARVAECSRSNVTQWLDGDVKSLKAISAANIQERTGFSARWLVLGKGAKKINSPHETAREIPPAAESDAQKLLAIIETWHQTDRKGRDAIWAGARLAMKRGASTKDGHRKSSADQG